MATSPAPHDPWIGHSVDWWQGRVDMLAERVNETSAALDRSLTAELLLPLDLAHFARDAWADSDWSLEEFTRASAALYVEQIKAKHYSGQVVSPGFAVPESMYPFPYTAS